jgi:hypothetical protein
MSCSNLALVSRISDSGAVGEGRRLGHHDAVDTQVIDEYESPVGHHILHRDVRYLCRVVTSLVVEVQTAEREANPKDNLVTG